MGSSLSIGNTNWTLIQKNVLSAPSDTITVSGIPAGYRIYFVLCVGSLTAGTQGTVVRLNTDATNTYVSQVITSVAPNVSSVQVLTTGIDAAEVTAAIWSSFTLWLFDMGAGYDVSYEGMGGNYAKSISIAGHWANNGITTIQWVAAGSTFTAGSNISVYGVI